MTRPKSLLLIISGSIAAYKSLELIRRLREQGVEVKAILTKGGEQFITPLSVASLTGTGVYTDLFSLKDEVEMGHIRLSRESDAILVAPASADIIAKMATGLCDDLATTTLLATDKPVIVAPAMNAKMWEHKATQRNISQLKKDGIFIIQPGVGDLACGEVGSGRMAEVDDILTAILSSKKNASAAPLKGLHALVTAGPTFEAIDPVRFIGNRSSGKQGYAVAEALRDAGATVTLISGPTALPAPHGVKTIAVESAGDMHKEVLSALPADIAICTAAVADWKPQFPSARKLKKRANETAPAITLTENPDILSSLSSHKKRPALVIGFAAETENLEKHAKEKRLRKGCDWVLANDVSGSKVFAEDQNTVLFVSANGAEKWKPQSKQQVAEALTGKIQEYFLNKNKPKARKLK